MTGLLGWAFGGFIFGIYADYVGRVRALATSIVIYSVFTALQGLSHGIWDFAIYRFIAGLGTGAELMVGIPLLAEALGETHRAKIAGLHDDRRCARHVPRRLDLWNGRRLWLARGVLHRRGAGAVARRHSPARDRARPFRRRERTTPDRQGRTARRRGRPRVHAFRAVTALHRGSSPQHHCRPAVRTWFAAGDLDHEHLAADDPFADGAKERCHRRRRRAVRQPRHHDLEPWRHCGLYRFRLHRRYRSDAGRPSCCMPSVPSPRD